MVKNKLIYISIVAIISFGSCNLNSQTSVPVDGSNKFIPEFSAILPLDQGTLMLQQCSRSVPENIDKYYVPTVDDVKKLENRFLKITKIESTDCCLMGRKINSLHKYGFQYIGVIIANRKYIYINAFLIHDVHFNSTIAKTSPELVCDGGEGFWGALFDVENGEFSQLAINGNV